MKLSKILKSTKYSLLAVNSLLLVIGFILLIEGLVVLFAYKDYSDLITKKFFNLCGFVIATAIITLLASALGYFAAISEIFHVIAGYVLVMVVILVFDVSMVIVSYGIVNGAAAEIRATMSKSMAEYSTKIQVAKLWDDMQTGFECCGVNGRSDWFWLTTSGIPVSCCHINYGTTSPFVCTEEKAYSTGCASALGNLLGHHAYVIAVTSVLAVCLQVLITAAAGWNAWKTKFDEIDLAS